MHYVACKAYGLMLHHSFLHACLMHVCVFSICVLIVDMLLYCSYPWAFV